jgi:hypothetical protein
MTKRKTNKSGLPHALPLKGGKALAKPEPFTDSFTTTDACFSVEVKAPWGEVTEDIEVKIDCGGMIHGDEELIDVLIEMLEKAKENLTARSKP